jgi:energy-coupling factor transporter ATP-binding protein EcfA2
MEYLGYDPNYITDEEAAAIEGRKKPFARALFEGKSSYSAVNMSLFEKGINNALFVIGAPGSGKSTLAKDLAERYGAKAISLDNGILSDLDTDAKPDWFDKRFFAEYPAHKKEFERELASLKAGKGNIDLKPGRHSYYDDYFEFALRYPASHRKERFVIEGIELADYDKGDGYYSIPLMGKDPSIVYMTTGVLRNISNLRERDRSWGEGSPSRMHDFLNTLKWKRSIGRFRKSIG